MKHEEINFGTWVIVDNDPTDQRQVVDYYPLQQEYKLDKNGVWDYATADRVKIDFRYK